MIAKDTSWLPNNENAWPVQMVKKRGAHGLGFSTTASTFITNSSVIIGF
jgi:hypothetical protein